MIQDKQTTHFRKYKEIPVLEIKEGSTILKNHGFSYTVESIQTISPNVRLLVLSDSKGNEVLEYATLDKNYNVREEQLNEKEDTQKQEKEKVSFDSRGRIGDPNRAVRPRGFPKRELTIGDLQDLVKNVKKESKDDPSPTPLSKGPWDKNPKSIESGQGSWKPLRNASADERAAIAKRLGRPSPAAKKAFKETMRKKFGPDWGRGEVGESFGEGPIRPMQRKPGGGSEPLGTKGTKVRIEWDPKFKLEPVPPVQRRTGSTRAEVRAGTASEPLGTKRKARVDAARSAQASKLDEEKEARIARIVKSLSEGKLYDRLVSQLLSRGMPKDKAHATATAQLQKSGSFKSGTRELTKHGKKRQAMGAAGRSKDRAAKRSGRKPSDYKYNPKTNGSSLKEENEPKKG